MPTASDPGANLFTGLVNFWHLASQGANRVVLPIFRPSVFDPAGPTVRAGNVGPVTRAWHLSKILSGHVLDGHASI